MNELLHPWMLLGLAAMALPLIIEWLFRRRRQRIAFPAMRYLMNPKKRRRVQLQDLILLLVRTVVPGLLVVALARPLLRPEAGQGTAQAPRHVAIVLDGTYSMGQSIGQTTAFALAQAMAQDVLRGLPKGTEVSLVYLGQRPELFKDRTADRDSVHDAIGRAKVSDMAGRMADAVAFVDKLLAEGTGNTPSPPGGRGEGEVYIISDLQRSTWAATPEDQRDLQALLAKLAQRHPTFILDTGGTNPFNAYFTRFEPREKVTAVGLENRFEVEIEARNMPANGKLWLTLYADDQASLATPSSLPLSPKGREEERKPGKIVTRELTAADLRGGRATVVLPHTFLQPGEHLLRVELEGDGLASDNQRFYLASVPANVDVLIVDPKYDAAPTADPLASGTGHLRNAIAPRTPPGFERLAPFAVTVRRPDEVLQVNLERFAVVVLANVGNLSDALVSRLEQYVGDGGNLLLFVGDAVVPYEYNTKLLKSGKGLLPCELQAPVGVPPAEALAQMKANPEKAAALLQGLVYAASEPHPAVANVRQLTRQPAPASVSRWMPMKLVPLAPSSARGEGDLGRPVVYLANRQPLACERRFGQGKVLLVGTSADASWNYLVYTSEYLVLMQELLRWLIGQPDRAVNLPIGETFAQPVLLSSQYLLLRRPDYSKVRLAPVAEGNLWRVAYNQTDRQGIYEVDTTAEVMARRRFVVNLTATEGDLTRLDAESFRRELTQAGVAYWGPDKAIRRAVEARLSVTEYAWLFLWALLAFLAIETLLATRFGRRRI
jgi:hypothetical protein